MEPSFNALIAPFKEEPPSEPALPAPVKAAPPPADAPPVVRQPATVDKPAVIVKEERPMPEMKPLVPLPEEWMRALSDADPKSLLPLEGTPVEAATQTEDDGASKIALVVACIVAGGMLGYMCFRSHFYAPAVALE